MFLKLMFTMVVNMEEMDVYMNYSHGTTQFEDRKCI